MKLPRKIRVLGTDWDVRYDPSILADSDEWANANSRTRTFTFHPDAELPVALIHELIHAIEHSVIDGTDPGHLKESQVQAVARGLVAIFKDNPRLADFLSPIPG